MADANSNAVELWRDIPDYPKYQVSNLGRVRSCKHERVLVPGRSGLAQGRLPYLTVNISDDKSRRSALVHRLIAASFIGPCPAGHEVNHIDGNKFNNALANLEYVTRSENERHARRIGLKNSNYIGTGEKHPHAKLTQQQADEIRSQCATTKLKVVDLAKRFNVSKRTITDVLLARTYLDSPDGPPSIVDASARRVVAKLTREQVVGILRRYRSGDGSCRSLAKEFGVSHETIRTLVNGETAAYREFSA